MLKHDDVSISSLSSLSLSSIIIHLSLYHDYHYYHHHHHHHHHLNHNCRVKSLHADGMGDLYDGVPRISLHDMQKHLAVFQILNRTL